MKKFIIITAIVFGILLGAIVTIPIFFKDDIRGAIDGAISENVQAEVFYDVDKFSLSLLKNFPDFTVGLGDFGIVGIDQFVGDTLLYVGNFQLTVDLMSVISGDQVIVEEVLLERPRIEILVMEDGKANYDIAKASETTEENTEDQESEASESADFKVGIKKWSIVDGNMIYLDQSMNFYTTLLGLNHEGSGDFTLDVFDLTATTEIAGFSLTFDGEDYINNQRLSADVTLNMDLSQMKFVLQENRIALNDFAIAADGSISMPGEDIDMDITFEGNDINLKSLLSLIPGAYQGYLEGITATGDIGFDGYIKGTFNERSMPKIASTLTVDNGRILYEDYPIPMEEIVIRSSFNYPSADLRETAFNVDKFHLLVDGEEVAADLTFKNLEDYTWDFNFDGNADLEKITKIIPVEGMDLKGKLSAQLSSSGKMSDIEAERYGDLPTSGNLVLADFAVAGDDLPQALSIQSANLSFNPEEITLSEFQAKTGNTDLSLKGKVSNYIGYVLGEGQTLRGRLDLRSDFADLNEWMVTEDLEEDSQGEETSTDTTSLEVIKVPEDIDFVLQADIARLAYTNLTLEDLKGTILIKNGAVRLQENSFDMLGGTFELSGSYRTKGLEKPVYDVAFSMKELSIPDAYNSFGTIQSYVPIAKLASGKFSANLSTKGRLGSDMMPLLNEMSLSGLLSVAEAALDKGQFVQKLSAVASLDKGGSGPSQSIRIKDVEIMTSIENGRLYVDPFDLTVGNQKATLGGSNSIDGSLDYSLVVKEVPTGVIGDAVNQALSSLTGGKKVVSEKINLNLGIQGTYQDPRVTLLSSSPASGQGASSTASIKESVNAQIEAQKAKAEAELAKQKAEAEAKLAAEKAAAEAKAKAEIEAAKKKAATEKRKAEEEAKRRLEEEKKKAEEAAKAKLKKLFKKGGGL